MELMNNINVYEFAKNDVNSLKSKYEEDVHKLIDRAYSFVGAKSDFVVKSNFELVIFHDDSTKLLLVAGKKQHKFLATYDIKGNPKIRRFAGQADLKPGQQPYKTKVVKEVSEDTMLELLKELWKKGKTSSEENPDNFAIGLLCMRIAHFLHTMAMENRTIKDNIEIAFYDSDDRLHIISAGRCENKVLATFDNKGNPVILHLSGQEYTSSPEGNVYILKCDEINTISLGRMISKTCGNEGRKDDDNTGKVRGLLQAAITYLPKEKDKVWKNAEITVYDDNYDAWKLRAGNGQKKFVANVDGNKKVEIVRSQ